MQSDILLEWEEPKELRAADRRVGGREAKRLLSVALPGLALTIVVAVALVATGTPAVPGGHPLSGLWVLLIVPGLLAFAALGLLPTILTPLPSTHVIADAGVGWRRGPKKKPRITPWRAFAGYDLRPHPDAPVRVVHLQCRADLRGRERRLALAMPRIQRLSRAAPLEVMRQCAAVGRSAEELVGIANPNLVTDVGVSAILAEAACAAARLNVEINLKYIKDSSLVDQTRTEIEDLTEATARCRQAVSARVAEHLT